MLGFGVSVPDTRNHAAASIFATSLSRIRQRLQPEPEPLVVSRIESYCLGAAVPDGRGAAVCVGAGAEGTLEEAGAGTPDLAL